LKKPSPQENRRPHNPGYNSLISTRSMLTQTEQRRSC
jgi:hypothetical protein